MLQTNRHRQNSRRDFIGGSDARIIMGQDEKALIRLWQEKRGEVGPEDLSGNLIVQLGLATEDLNRTWYERNTGRAITAVQTRVKHPVIAFMAATLDGVVAECGGGPRGGEGLMDSETALPSRSFVDPLAEPDAGSASIFFYELHTRRFKSSFYNVECCSTWLVRVRLKLAHCYDADPSFVCEVLLTPVEEATRGPALFRCDHSSRLRGMTDSINCVENRLTSQSIGYNHFY